MRNLLLPLLVVTTALAGCLSGDDTTDDPSDDPFATEEQPWFTNWSTLRAELTIDIDPTAGGSDASQPDSRPLMTGEGTFTIHNARDVEMGWVNFFGGLTLTRVTDETGQRLSVDGGNVTLDGPTAPGTTRTLTVAFEGRSGDALVPVSGADEFSAHYFTAAPYTSGSTNAVAQVHANVTSPVDWTVLLAADRVSESVQDDVLTRHYFGLYPYLVGFVGDGLLSLQDEVDGVEVRTWYYPSQLNQGQAMHTTAVKILRHVPDWTGAYPFDHIWTVPHHVNVNAFSVPGINYMGWTFYRPGFSDAPAQFGRDLIPIFGHGQNSMENVLVHETVHNWWGHIVRGNNSNADADGERDTWMTEGITTYLAETVWFDRIYGEAAAKESAEHMVRAVQTLTNGPNQANGAGHPETGECSVTEACGDYYVKGALSMRALEAYGIATGRPDLTMDLLKHSLQVHGRQTGGTGVADTSDFVKTFEAAAGEDLSWWYDAWHYSRDLADFTITDVSLATDGVTVTVDNLGGAKGAALVEVELLGGQTVRGWTVVDGTASSTFTIPAAGLAGPVVTATVDPLQHVYESDETNNVWTLMP